VRYLVGVLLVGLCLAASGCGGEKTTATTVITVSGPYRYPPSVIKSFMRSCTQGKPKLEALCACVIDKLSYSVSNRDFARILRVGKAVPRVRRATNRATAACRDELS
jgi:hypothetical protein